MNGYFTIAINKFLQPFNVDFKEKTSFQDHSDPTQKRANKDFFNIFIKDVMLFILSYNSDKLITLDTCFIL